ncbi:MAG: hypothetical protein AAFY71_27925 [Bacteroidota bacterium]
MNVLIFEREEDILDLLTYNLETKGFTVTSCEERNPCCSCMESYNPDIILVGNVGIDEDLIKFGKSLLDSFPGKSIPMVCLTTKEESLPLLSTSSVFDLVLSTPIKPKSIVLAIKELLNMPIADAA